MFRRRRFLLTAIEANGFVPEQIVVEFTESEAISRFEEFTSAVRQLKSAGISVAIDHFGAGFAGLQLLAQFQPDRIKINRDLIANVHKSGPRQAIIQSIIKCCASLEILFCAVGVELAEEWMWLESAGISQFVVTFSPARVWGHSGDCEKSTIYKNLYVTVKSDLYVRLNLYNNILTSEWFFEPFTCLRTRS